MDPAPSAPDGELLGSMLVGLLQALRNVQAISATRTAQLLEGVESDAWYPMSRFFTVIEEIRQYEVDADPILFRAGLAFAQDWFERFDGRKIFPSARAYIEAQRKRGGYSKVHRGDPDKIGWLDVLELDAAAGRAVLECITPYPREFERGLMHGGVWMTGDVDYVRVESAEEAYNRHLTRKTLSIVYHPKSGRQVVDALDRFLAGISPSAPAALPPALQEAAIWRLKSIEEQAERDRLYYRQSDLLLAKAAEQVRCAERELIRAKQEAEAANLAKSQFLATMSHEMRTPLHVIIGLCHLMRRDLETPAQLSRLDQLGSSSDHLLAIINDVLDLSKIDAGELALDRGGFVLRDVVDKVVRMIEQRASEKGIAFSALVAPEAMQAAVVGDALRLAQVLINLCGNAVKFTDHGAVVLRIDVGDEDNERVAIRFAVEDTGIGIAAVDRARLFKPFTQLDASVTRERGGTGLGLAISQRLVTLMGGRIEVASSVGIGSCFSFDVALPRDGAVAAASPVERAPVQAFIGARVLLADDHPVGRDVVAEMLERMGCEVELAVNGSEAVERASTRNYDVILMDMQMPKMDGLAATQAIRTLPEYRGTPIVALTANAFAEDRERCLQAGMSGHLSKPVTPEALAAVLYRWLPGGEVEEADMAPAAGAPDDETRDFEIPEIWAGSRAGIETYLAQIERFCALHGKDMERLQQLLAAGDDDAVFSLVHRLKGAAGTLGVSRVAALAGEIERAWRSQAGEAIVNYLVELCRAELAGVPVSLGSLRTAV